MAQPATIRWIVAYPGPAAAPISWPASSRPSSRLRCSSGTTVIVDNRPGAAGIIGTDAAAKAPGDGYTILTGDNGAMVFHTALYKSLPYDPKDFVPLGFMASFPLILAVHPGQRLHRARASSSTW